jgi:hypothetical protein
MSVNSLNLEELEKALRDLEDQFDFTMELWDRIVTKELERVPRGTDVIARGLGAFHKQSTEMIEAMQARVAELRKKDRAS